MTDNEIETLAAQVVEAVEMLIAKRIGDALKLDERLRDLEVAGQSAARVDSLERRASRQGEHLAALESRMKKLER